MEEKKEPLKKTLRKKTIVELTEKKSWIRRLLSKLKRNNKN